MSSDYEDLKKKVLKEIESSVDNMVIELIDRGYSKEIENIYPSSITLLLLKNIFYIFLILSIISYIILHNIIVSIVGLIIGILCLWLSGILRGVEIRKMILSNEENHLKFNNMFNDLIKRN